MKLKSVLNRLFQPSVRRKSRRKFRAIQTPEPLEQRLLLSAVSGRVFEDTSGDGIRDEGERFLSGLPVSLWDVGLNGQDFETTLTATSLTDASGSFHFDVDVTSKYTLKFGDQSGPYRFSSSGTDALTGFTTVFEAGTLASDFDWDVGLLPSNDQQVIAQLNTAFNFEPSRSDYHFDVYHAGEKWLRGDQGPWSRDYFITPNGDLYNWDKTPRSVSGQYIGNVGAGVYQTPSFLHDAVLDSPDSTVAEVAYRLDQEHRLVLTGKLHEDYGDLGVRWMAGKTNVHNTIWYFVTPNGEFWAWDGMAEQATGSKLADLSADYFNDPVLISNPLRPSIAGSDNVAYIKDAFDVVDVVGAPDNLTSASDGIWLEGAWNEFGNNRYFVNASGDFHAWDGTGAPSGRVLATLPQTVHGNPALLTDALFPLQGSTTQEKTYELDSQLNLTSHGWYFEDWGGANEKWIRGASNLHGTEWYFVLQNGDFYAWENTGRAATGTKLVTLSPLQHEKPYLLHAALQPADVPVPPANQAPQLSVISPQKATVGAELVVNVSATDSAAQQTLTFALDTETSPTGATIQDNGDRTATVRWTPQEIDLPGPVGFTVFVTDNGNPPLADSKSFTVTLDTQGDAAPPVLTAGLLNDTGHSDNDGVTSDPQISGSVIAASAIQSFRAGFDDTAEENYVDVLSEIAADGSFVLDETRLQAINGGAVSDGNRTVHLKAINAEGDSSSTDVIFTLDTSVPPVPSAVSLSVTSQATAPNNTTSARVSLVGLAEPNVFVKLVGLNATGLASNSGAFQIPRVELSLGANSLMVRAEDAAGNVSGVAPLSIARLEASTQSDPVLVWNQTLLEAIRLDASTPPFASRAMAMVHAAIFDAVNAIEGKPAYYVALSAEQGASAEAAVAAAGHGVLSHLYPAMTTLFDTTQANSIANVADGQSKTDGIALGQAAAEAIIRLRSGDGWDDFVDYIPRSGIGEWQPTLPVFDVALLPQWADLAPFSLVSPDQYRPTGPPDVNSAAYADALNEVQQLGRAVSTTRTADQSEVAQFWIDGLGTETPPGHWNRIAAEIASAEGNSLAENARLFAQLNLALADAAIAAWDAKYSFEFWRPITAIRSADADSNQATLDDNAWLPLASSPPFPEYVSGHSTFSGAAETVLTAYFGEDYAFTDTTLALPGVTRSFDSFRQAAEEAGRSRVYGGIHFEFSNQDGIATGRSVGQHVLDSFTVASDQLAPTITFDTPAAIVSSENVTIVGSVLDNIAGVESLELAIDNEEFVAVPFDARGQFSVDTSFALDGSTEGQHVFRFRATDFSGNTSALRQRTITLDTIAPQLTITSPIEGATVAAGDTLIGSIDGTGSVLRSLSYKINDELHMPLATDAGSEFELPINVWRLAPGTHQIKVTATDSAGLTTSQTRNFIVTEQPDLMISGINPGDNAVEVGSTFRPQVFFSRPIDPETINENNFFATDPGGEKIAAHIVPANDGTFAWLFFDKPLPGGATVAVTVGNEDIATSIKTPEGGSLDANQNGEQGGTFEWEFTTVSLTPLAGTTLTGIVADPGSDRKPGTLDDVRSGPDGVLGTADDEYLNPIVGAHVYILGLEDHDVVTDADGRFTLTQVPAGNVKLVIDGMTASDAPDGIYFPEMVMDLNILGGRTNTVMAAMEPVPSRRAETDMNGVYLPRIETSILETVMADETKTIRVDAASAPNLTTEQRAMLTLEIQPQSLVAPDGTMLDSGQIGISTVPPELVRDMLPPGLLQHTFDITIQAPGISNFSTPMPMTFPNTMGAAPGTKLDFLSFDHTTGRLVIEGTATVSEDGKSVHTDPDTGITHPGWHGLTPSGGCGGSGGDPNPPIPEPPPGPVPAPVLLPLIIGESGAFPMQTWTAYDKIPEPTPPPPPPPGCPVPPRDKAKQPYVKVDIKVDGPLKDFMKKTGDLNLKSTTFMLPAGSGKEHKFGGEAKSYKDLFGGVNPLASQNENLLYGSTITITEERREPDGREHTLRTVYELYRFIDVTDANHNDKQVEFEDTLVGGMRAKPIKIKSGSASPVLSTVSPFGVSASVVQFSPTSASQNQSGTMKITTSAGDPIGEIALKGDGERQVTYNLDISSFDIFNPDDFMDAIENAFEDDMNNTERAFFGTVSSGGILTFDESVALTFVNDVITEVDRLYSPFGVEHTTSTDSATVKVVDFEADFGSSFGYAFETDIATGGFFGGPYSLGNLYVNQTSYSTSERHFRLSEILNENEGGFVDAYFNNYFIDRARNERLLPQTGSTTWTRLGLVQSFAMNIAHEVGHRLGLPHTNIIDPVDVMAQGIVPPARSFQTAANTLKVALGLPWSIQEGNLAFEHLMRQQHGTANGIAGDVDGGEVAVKLPDEGLALPLDSATGVLLSEIEFRIVVSGGASLGAALFNGGLSTIEIEDVSIVGGDGQFSITGLNTGDGVESADRQDFSIAFAPLQSGPSSATLVLMTSALNSEIRIPISAVARPETPTLRAVINESNIGSASAGTGSARAENAIALFNDGSEDLQISAISFAQGGVGWALTNVPLNLDTNPIILGSGESYSFGTEFRPPAVGLQHAIIEVTSNHLGLPVQQISIVGTGLDDVVYPDWGDDYVAIEFPDLPGDRVLRAVSDPTGNFEFFLPPTTSYHLTIFDPVTGLVSHGYGTTPASGQGIDLTATLVFDASIAPDSDFDGLPDDIEYAIGTQSNAIDTDGDGLTDFAEIEQGLDPLTGFNVQTGVIASLALPGESNQVVVTGTDESSTTQNAFVATGTHGLAIVDVSQFDNPLILGQLELAGEATDVAVDTTQNLAVLATNAGGLQIVDVANPTRPVLRRVIPGDFSRVEIVNGTIYGSRIETLFAFDLRSGIALSSVAMPEVITDLTWDGRMLYTMELNSRLSVVDVSNGVLQPRGNVTLPNGGGSIFSADNIVYAAAANHRPGGFATANVSDPDNPVVISGSDAITQSLPKTGFVPNGSGLGLLVGQAEFVAGQGEPPSLTVLDVSDPENTASFLTRIDLDIAPTSVSQAGGIAFVTDSSGLRVINYLAFDNQGEPPIVNTTVDAESMDVDLDTPGIQIYEGALIPVSANVVDDVQVRNVELLVDGQVVQGAFSFPFNLAAIAPLLPDGIEDGQFTIQVRATDTGGNTALSDPIIIQIRSDIFAPIVDRFVVNLPDEDPGTPGSQLFGEADLGALFAASDTGGLQTVELLRNGEVIAALDRPAGVFQFATASLADDEAFRDVELRLRVTDRAGNIALSELISYRVVRDTFPPTIAAINLEDGDVKRLGVFSLNVDFSEPMDPATLTAAAFNLTGPSGPIVPENFAIADDVRGVQVRYTLPEEGAFTLTVDAPAMRDHAGNLLGNSPIIIDFEVDGPTESLFLGQQFPAGRGPTSVTTGDFNGDGVLDLAVANTSSDDVSVLLGNGDGTFDAEQRFAAGNGSTSVTTGDFNGDGLIDLAVANFQSDDVSVLLGNGDGTFADQLRFVAGDSPQSVTTGDFNGDGVLDLAVANYSSDDVSVLMGNGDGTFADQLRFATGDTPFSVTTGDFNRDGLLDLVVANLLSDDVSVLLGNGDGTFAAQLQFAAGDSPHSVTTGDFDGDGVTDLAVANWDSGDVSVLLGSGDGTFAPHQRFAAGNGPDSVTTGDFNGDGIIDLAVANTPSADMFGYVLIGNGDGTFANPKRFTAGPSPQSVTTGDFNGDGVLDLVVANRLGGDVSVLVGNGDGTFVNSERFAAGDGPLSVTTGDFNGDVVTDLAVANRDSDDVSVLLGNGDGTFAAQLRFAAGDAPQSVTTGDFNGDGLIDLVIANHRQGRQDRWSMSVLLGNGDGTFAAQDQFAMDRGPQSVTTGDFNGDGLTDLVVANTLGDDVSVLVGNGDGTFAAQIQFAVGRSPQSVTTGDFNGDGLIDLAVANRVSDDVSVLVGNGDGTFGDQLRFAAGDSPKSVTTGDFNGDGFLDLVVTNYNQLARKGSVSVLLGNGDGTFADQNQFAADGPQSVTTGDFNDDGLIDLAVANGGAYGYGDEVSVLLGNGDGTFAPELRFAAGDRPQSVTTGDFNGDGLIDLVVANGSSDDVSVLLNQR